jgi:hypothetical protein
LNELGVDIENELSEKRLGFDTHNEAEVLVER